MNIRDTRAGFTLIELLLVMGIITLLFSISTLLLSNLIPKASQTSGVEVLIADLRQQQAKAMEGETSGETTAQAYGIKFSAHEYIVFRGTTYSAAATDNFALAIDEPLQLSTTFPNQEVAFTKGSGEIISFVPGSNTITISDAQGGSSTTLVLNQYGVITQIN